MKQRTPFVLLAWLVVVALPAIGGTGAVRPPAVAGTFYPGDARELAASVDQMLARAVIPALEQPPIAIVAPHAGYVYSGGVAAHSYALINGMKVGRVVVIAPSHYEAFPFVSVYDGAAYTTPLGQVAVDEEFAARLAAGGDLRRSSRGHAVTSEFREHALEVQLPFLQRVLGPFKLVPVVMGEQSYELSRALGVALAKLIREPGTLIVASSDLSHFHPYDAAVRLDRSVLRAIEEWDYLSASGNFEERVWEACGGGPIVAAMIAAERLGANQARVIRYANSGDTSGDRSRVVGYGSVALFRSEKAAGKAAPFALAAPEKQELLRIARKAVETFVRSGKPYEWNATEASPGLLSGRKSERAGMARAAAERLMQERGAFVTLKKNGELRGCIGYTAPRKPLGLTVRDVATLAAARDDRFPPVSAGELAMLEYEISVLSPMRRVLDVKQIRLGQHGLLLRKGGNLGVFLPQVPVEQGWDRTAYLQNLCRKAGLPPNAWMAEDADVFWFTAEVFGRERPVSSRVGAEEEQNRGQPGQRPATAPGLPKP